MFTTNNQRNAAARAKRDAALLADAGSGQKPFFDVDMSPGLRAAIRDFRPAEPSMTQTPISDGTIDVSKLGEVRGRGFTLEETQALVAEMGIPGMVATDRPAATAASVAATANVQGRGLTLAESEALAKQLGVPGMKFD
jgi:ribosomal protein L13E